MSAEVSAIETLLPKLHRRGVIGWEDELRCGKPVYDELVTRLRAKKYSAQLSAGCLTPHQVANALVVVHRLRTLGSDEEVFTLIEDSLAHYSIRVRDQAVSLYIGMMRDHRWQAPYYTEETRERLSQTLSRGLHKDSQGLATTLLERGPEACELE